MRKLLNKVAGQTIIIEILYMNSRGDLNKHILDCIDLKIGNRSKNFETYAYDAGKVLKFSVANIRSIKVLTLGNTQSLTFGKWYRQWTHIFSENLKCEADGIYVIACRGDQHLIFELFKLEKNSRFWDQYTGNNAHCQGWYPIDPLAYHYLPPYTPNILQEYSNLCCWEPFDLFNHKPNEYLAPHSGIYVRAYEIEGIKISNPENGKVPYYLGDHFHSVVILSSGINYDYIILHKGDEILNDYKYWDDGMYNFTSEVDNKTITIKYLGYTCFSPFTNADHTIHWKLYEGLDNASKENINFINVKTENEDGRTNQLTNEDEKP